MGCHTWFSVPFKTDKEEIIKLAQDYLNSVTHYGDDYKKMYQLAIDHGLQGPILELAADGSDSNVRDPDNWILYKDIVDNSIEEHHKKTGVLIDRYDYEAQKKEGLENYSNEPRIGGYPDRIVRSYDDMVDFMKTGHTLSDGTHCDFNCDADRLDKVMEGIKQFFFKHPDGIITFG
jgi:hypothetical protein